MKSESENVTKRSCFPYSKLDFIKTLFDNKGTDVAVFTSPRRFGKTLNLSMLHYFLAKKINGEETQGLFDGLKIAKCGDEYMQYQGKYPVVSVTFKDIKASNYRRLSRIKNKGYFHIRMR